MSKKINTDLHNLRVRIRHLFIPVITTDNEKINEIMDRGVVFYNGMNQKEYQRRRKLYGL